MRQLLKFSLLVSLLLIQVFPAFSQSKKFRTDSLRVDNGMLFNGSNVTPLLKNDQLYTSLSNLVSTIGGSEQAEVAVFDTLVASSNVTVPANIRFDFRGGLIRISAGVTVTFASDASVSHNGSKKLFILDNANTSKVIMRTINVAHFGAVGDSTTNSFDALHAASLQVRDGATLLVPGGEYRAGGPLYSGGTAWERDSTNSIIWLYRRKNINVVFEQGASISIDDSARTMGINAKQCTTMVIDDARFYGPAKNGYVQESYVITHPMIFIQGGYSIRINNPWTEGSHSFGIFVTHTYKHDKPWSTNGNDGGERRPTRDVIINNLTAINCGTDKINDGHNVVVEGINLTVNGGYIRRARGRGIEIFATDPAAGALVDGITIRGIKMRDVDRDGIATFAVEDSVLERHRNIIVENCDIDSVGLTDGDAISMNSLSPGTPMEGGVIIRNNLIRNNGIDVRAIGKSLIYGNRLVNGTIYLRNHGKEWWEVHSNVIDSTQYKGMYLNHDGSDNDTGYFNVWGNTIHNANLSGSTANYHDCAIQIEFHSTTKITGNDFSKNDSLSKVIYYSGAKAQYIANNIMPSGMSKSDFFKLNAAIEDTLRLTNFNNRNAEYESANFVNFFTIDSTDWDFYQKDSLRLGEMRLVINDNPQWNGEPYRALMFRERTSSYNSDIFMLPGEWSYYDYEFPRTTSTIFLLTFRNGNLRNSYFHPGALSITGGKRWFDFEDVEAGTTTFAEGNAYGSYAAVFDSTNFIMTKTAGFALSGANLPTGDFTLELRVFMTAANGAESALRYLTVKNGGSNMSISANTGSGWLPTATVTDQSANSRAVTSGVDIADDAWHLITLSHDQDGYTRLYIDQVAQDSSNTALSSNVMINNSELSLGGWLVGANARFFEGKISDVRLLNEAITY